MPCGFGSDFSEIIDILLDKFFIDMFLSQKILLLFSIDIEHVISYESVDFKEIL